MNSYESSSSSGSGEISDRIRSRKDMEAVIKKLADVQEQRDETLDAVKETIKECKEKVAKLMTEAPSRRTSAFPWCFITAMSKVDWGHPDTWKFIAGSMLMIYLLITDLCYRVVPPFPKCYAFIHFALVLFHLFLSRIWSLVLGIARTMGQLRSDDISYYEGIIERNQSMILLMTNCSAIGFLKLMRCCGCCGGLELLITFATGIGELAHTCFKHTLAAEQVMQLRFYVTMGIISNLLLSVLL